MVEKDSCVVKHGNGMKGADLVVKDNVFKWKKKVSPSEAAKFKLASSLGLCPEVNYDSNKGYLYSEAIGFDLSNLKKLGKDNKEIYIKEIDKLQTRLRNNYIAHCDIKPANLIYQNKKIYIIDWDHAKVFGEGREVYTPGINDNTTMKIYGYSYKCDKNTDDKGFEYVKTFIRSLPGDFDHAKNIEILGTYSYKFEDGYINVYIEKLKNNRNGRSGTIKVILKCTESAYQGGSANGYNLVEFTLDPLEKNYYYHDIKRKLFYKKPPKGIYFITFFVCEFTDNCYKISDSGQFLGDFKSVYNSGNVLSMNHGGNKYSYKGSDLALTIDKIIFRSNDKGSSSGTIKVEFIVSDTPYNWDKINSFYVLASFTLEPLKYNEYYTNIVRNLKMKTVKSKKYYPTILLYRYSSELKYEVVDFVAFDKAIEL